MKRLDGKSLLSVLTSRATQSQDTHLWWQVNRPYKPGAEFRVFVCSVALIREGYLAAPVCSFLLATWKVNVQTKLHIHLLGA